MYKMLQSSILFSCNSPKSVISQQFFGTRFLRLAKQRMLMSCFEVLAIQFRYSAIFAKISLEIDGMIFQNKKPINSQRDVKISIPL